MFPTRKLKPETGAPGGDFLESNRAAHLLNKVLYDGEAEARAANRTAAPLVDSVEPLKNTFAILCRETQVPPDVDFDS